MNYKLILISAFVLLVTLASAFAQNSWRSTYYDVDHDEDIGIGNQLLNTEFWLTTSYCSGSDNANSIYVGNLDNNPTNREMLVACDSAIEIYNMTLYEINHISPSGVISAGIQLYDYDGDGIDEIFGYSGTTLKIYKYNAGLDNWTIEKSFVYGANIGALSCYEGFCYFLDQYANLNKYNPTTNTVVDQINEGQTNTCGRITIDECNSQIAGKEIVWMLDEDGDGKCDDLGMVGLSFTGEKFYNDAGTSGSGHALVDEIECATDSNATYIGTYVPYWTSVGGSCGFENDFFEHQRIYVHKINSSDQLELVTVEGIDSLGTTGSSFNGAGAGGDIEFVDFHEDGDLDVCFAYSTLGRTGCNGVNTYSYSASCYNLDGSSITTLGIGLDSSNPDFQSPVESSVMDIDNDGSDEWFFGGLYVNLDTGTAINMNPVRDATNQIFSHFGGFCLNQYWSVDNYLYGDFSSATCNFTGDSFGVSPGIPLITDITYLPSTNIDLLTTDTIDVDATAEDYESDPIYWTHTCDYSGETDPIRVSEEYFSIGTNITELSRRFHVGAGISDDYEFVNVYDLGGSIGYVLNFTMWNVSNGDEYVQAIKRNATDTGTPLTSNIITIHFSLGFYPFGASSATDGIFIAGRDSGGLLMWGLHIDYNYSEPSVWKQKIYRLNSSAGLELLQINNNIADSIYVIVDMDAQTYIVSIDNDFDGDTDFSSAEYPLTSTVSDYQDTYLFSTGTVITNETFYDLGQVEVSDNVWLDTLFIEHSSLPSFSTSSSSTEDFECIYSGVGTYEIRTWVTDDNHPNDYSSYEAQSIVVTQSSQPAEVDCDGYVSPTCTGICYFTDNFDHTYSIACNDWQGANLKTPINNELEVEQIGMDALSISLDYINLNQDQIDSEEYDSFSVDFDYEAQNESRVAFFVSDTGFSKYLTYVYFEGGNIYLVQQGVPILNNIGQYDVGVQGNLNFVFSFRNQIVQVILNGNASTLQEYNFFDNDVEDAGGWYLQPVDFNDGYVNIDNFEISYGDVNPEFDGQIDSAEEYVYNSNFFCALNWTGTDPEFSEQNCIDRGYQMNNSLAQLCFPRACLSDIANGFFQMVTDNLFITIIITIVLILIIPLIIALKKKVSK